jgi:hypothetical protein
LITAAKKEAKDQPIMMVDKYTGSMKCDNRAPWRPSTFHLRILSLHDIVRRRLPNWRPIHVWMQPRSTGIEPSPVAEEKKMSDLITKV